MDTTQWQELIFSLCRYTGMPRPQEILDTGMITVDGMPALILFDGTDQLTIRFDVGEPPAQQRHQLFETMLVSNFIMGIKGACVWSRHPVEDHVVCSYCVPLPTETTGIELAESLEGAAQETRRIWEKTLKMLDKSPHAVDTRNMLRP